MKRSVVRDRAIYSAKRFLVLREGSNLVGIHIYSEITADRTSRPKRSYILGREFRVEEKGMERGENAWPRPKPRTSHRASIDICYTTFPSATDCIIEQFRRGYYLRLDMQGRYSTTLMLMPFPLPLHFFCYSSENLSVFLYSNVVRYMAGRDSITKLYNNNKRCR